MASFSRLEKSVPLFKQVTDVLIEQMVGGEIRMGARLSESLLSEQLGISRTPVREALRTLEAEGWVEESENGYVVFSASLQDFEEMSQCRAVLEALAAKSMALQASNEEIEQLKTIYETTEQALAKGDNEQVLQLNQTFHEHIVQSSHNSHLLKLLTPLKGRIYMYRFVLSRYDRLQTFLPDHKHIVEAIAERDEKKAETMMLEHLHNDLETMKTSLQSN
ncbi:MAG TPA: GntR family transcriptional regulator [Bacillales bacterium]|nr:GntR family transcriptional regulator [Bacillales bacterium]